MTTKFKIFMFSIATLAISCTDDDTSNSNDGEYVTFQMDNNPERTITTDLTVTALEGGILITNNNVSITDDVTLFSNIIPNENEIYTSSEFSLTFTEFRGTENEETFGFGPEISFANTIAVKVENLGNVGEYIDINITGTFNDIDGEVHNLNYKAHVIRDF